MASKRRSDFSVDDNPEDLISKDKSTRDVFAEFLRLFFPDRTDNLDLTRREWLDKELIPDLPEGDVFTVDRLVDVPRRSPPDQPAGPALVPNSPFFS